MNLTYGSENRKATGIVEFSTSSEDDIAALEVLNSMVSTSEFQREYLNQYEAEYEDVQKILNGVNYTLPDSEDNCTFNCASFVIKNASLLFGINEGSPDKIKTSGGTIRTDRVGNTAIVPPINIESYTPNRVFSIANKQGKVLKGGSTKSNKQPFLEQVTGYKMKVILKINIVLLIFLGCNKINPNIKKVIGCWNTDENNIVEFTTTGDYIINQNEKWKYKFISDSLIQLYNTSFDTSSYDKPLRLIYGDSKKLILYDSMWSKEYVFSKNLNCK